MNRREFLERSAVAAGAAMIRWPAEAAVPWYRRTYLWGQTNITEKDPVPG